MMGYEFITGFKKSLNCNIPVSSLISPSDSSSSSAAINQRKPLTHSGGKLDLGRTFIQTVFCQITFYYTATL